MGVTVSWATHGGVEEAFGSRFLNSTENRRNYSIPIQLFICKSTSFVWGGSWFDAWVVGSSFETIYFPWGEWPVMAVFPLPDLGSRRTTILKYVLHEFAIYGHGTTNFLQHVKVASGSVITPLDANQADGSVKKSRGYQRIHDFKYSSVCVNSSEMPYSQNYTAGLASDMIKLAESQAPYHQIIPILLASEVSHHLQSHGAWMAEIPVGLVGMCGQHVLTTWCTTNTVASSDDLSKFDFTK